MVIKHSKVRCPKCNGAGVFIVVDPGSLRTRRQRAGVSLRTFAKAIGLSAPYLSDVEHGRRNCTNKIEAEYAKL